jgi:diguanylate cyclase (GGDEF)-like protein
LPVTSHQPDRARDPRKPPIDTQAVEALLARAWDLHLSRPAESFALAEQALAQASARHDDRSAAWAQLAKALARWRWIGADIDATRADFRSAARMMAALGDERGMRLAELETAALFMKQGKWPEALAAFEALIGRFDLNQLDLDNFYPLLGLSTSYIYCGNLAEGLRFGYAGLHLAQQLDLLPQQANMTIPLGVALMAARDPEESANLYERAESIAESIGSPMMLKTIRTNLAVVLRRTGRLAEAEQRVRAVLAEPEPMIGGQQFAHFCAAELFILQGRIEDAEAQLAAATAVLAGRPLTPLDAAKVHFISGLIASRRGRMAEAVASFRSAERDFADLSALRFSDRAQVYEELGAALAAQGSFEEAYLAQRKSAQEYLGSVQALNRLRRFSMQVRHEINRVRAELERETHERRSLQSSHLRLREQMELTLHEAQRLKNESTHDMLTGLVNRRYLDEALPNLLRLSQQSATPVAIAFVDLDRFKQVNDDFGHGMGDAVLRDFAQIALECMRGSDIIGRYGGEEFVVALIGCGPAAARARLENLLQRLQKHSVRHDGETLEGVSFTAGVAIYPEDGTEIAPLMGAADRRLYEAKRAGRARVACDDAAAFAR